MSEESPSPEQVADAINQGVEVVSSLVGAIVGIVQNASGEAVAVTASGEEVPGEDLGTTYADGEKIEPETWIEGVPNTATLGLGLVALVLVAAVLR